MVDGYDVFKKQIAQTALLSADTGVVCLSINVLPLLFNFHCQMSDIC